MLKIPYISGNPKEDNKGKVKPDDECLLYFLKKNGGGVKEINDFGAY